MGQPVPAPIRVQETRLALQVKTKLHKNKQKIAMTDVAIAWCLAWLQMGRKGYKVPKTCITTQNEPNDLMLTIERLRQHHANRIQRKEHHAKSMPESRARPRHRLDWKVVCALMSTRDYNLSKDDTYNSSNTLGDSNTTDVKTCFAGKSVCGLGCMCTRSADDELGSRIKICDLLQL
jgi:hypothetical protein